MTHKSKIIHLFNYEHKCKNFKNPTEYSIMFKCHDQGKAYFRDLR